MLKRLFVRRARQLSALALMALTSACGVSIANPTGSTADSSTNTTTVATPTPTPTPTPSTTVTVPVISPNGLAGETAIADNFDYASAFEPTTYGANGGVGIPPITPLNDLGAFRFLCHPGQLLHDDPIVYPGQPGKSHLHMFIGNTGANANSTYQSLRTTGGSTCDNQGQSFAINRSSYWTPAMMDGAGDAVLPDYVLVYYKRFPASGPGCVGPMAVGICTDLPNGLRFIFGYNMTTMTGGPTGIGTRDYWSMSYQCWSNEANTVPIPATAQANFHTIADVAAAGCPAGARLHVSIEAPTCWDGKNLDTADHRSHIVYAPDGTDKGMGYVCPADHPYVLPLISYQWLYTLDDNFVAGKWHLVSDEMFPGIKAGTTLHMDYFEAWSTTARTTWQRNCINGPMSCSSGDMGDGTAIKGAGVPAGGWITHQLVALTSLSGTTSSTPTSTPTTQVCPDGSVIPLTQTCPLSSPSPAPKTSGGKALGRKK